MTVLELISQLTRTASSLKDEVVMPDGEPVTSVSRGQACGVVYLGDAPEEHSDEPNS